MGLGCISHFGSRTAGTESVDVGYKTSVILIPPNSCRQHSHLIQLHQIVVGNVKTVVSSTKQLWTTLRPYSVPPNSRGQR